MKNGKRKISAVQRITWICLFQLTAPSEDEVRSFLSRQAQSRFSYSEVGASNGQLPPNYNIDHNRVRLGRGDAVWLRAKHAIRSWEMFNISWLRMCASTSAIEVGTDVVLSVHHCGFYAVNACRIVYIVNDDGPVKRFGFAYGTLLDHAESGEERFTVEWDRSDDAVWYDILAFSRPRRFLAKLGYPMSRSLQRKFGNDSMAAMLRAVGSPHSSPEPSQAR